MKLQNKPRAICIGMLYVYMFLLNGCVSTDNRQAAEGGRHMAVLSESKPALQKAITMSPVHENDKPLTLYGLALGESRESVESKYAPARCWKDVYFARCWINVDLKGVNGILQAEKTAIFVTYKDSIIYSIGVQLGDDIFIGTRKALLEMYGQPTRQLETQSIWRYGDAGVVLGERVRNTAAYVNYVSNLDAYLN